MVEEVSEAEALLAAVLRVVEVDLAIEEAVEVVGDSAVPRGVVVSPAALLLVAEVASAVAASRNTSTASPAFGRIPHGVEEH